jgi:hypothetical protein
MTSSQWPVASDQWPVTSGQSPAAVIGELEGPAGDSLLTTGH